MKPGGDGTIRKAFGFRASSGKAAHNAYTEPILTNGEGNSQDAGDGRAGEKKTVGCWRSLDLDSPDAENLPDVRPSE